MAISFSPQNYTVPEGTPADIMIVLDKPSPKDITITVTTMDITAQSSAIQSDGQSLKTLSLLHTHTLKSQTFNKIELSFLFHLDSDYIGGSFDMFIPAETVSKTLLVFSLRDNFVEDDEYFKATLNLPDAPEAVVVGTPDVAFVSIADYAR